MANYSYPLPNHIIDVIVNSNGVSIRRSNTGWKHYHKVSLNWFLFWAMFISEL